MSEKSKIAALKRRLANSAFEVLSIVNQGRSALKDPKHSPTFKGMYTTLEKYYSIFENCFDDLVGMYETIDAESKAEVGAFPTTEDQTTKSNTRRYYFECKSIYITLTEDRNPTGNEGACTSHQSSTIIHETSSKLPEIKLPKFDGEILNWPRFRDTFVSIVHEDSSLTSTKKFHYLIISLTGPALTLVSKFPIQEGNYELAWKSLNEAYNKNRLLATAYLNQILNFHPLNGKPTVESLRSFMTSVGNSVASFQLLEINDRASFILFHLAYRLLDQSIREQFQNSHKDIEFPTFNDLQKFIKERCFALELSSNTNVTFDQSFPSIKPKFNSKPRITESKYNLRSSSKSSLVTQPKIDARSNSNKTELDKRPNCIVCQESPHSLLSCRKFMDGTVEQRFVWLEKWKGCTNCLSIKHQLNTCNSRWVCRWCKQRHNSLLCKAVVTNQPSNSSGVCAVVNSEATSPNLSCSMSGNVLNVAASLSSPRLFATAIVEAQDARGVFQTVRIVIDHCSHYSFMTKACAKRLGLSVVPFSFNLSGIGQTKEAAKGYVNCSIRPRQESSPVLDVQALVLKAITTPLPSVSLSNKLNAKYSNYLLADPTFHERKVVDILLGVDLFRDIWLDGPHIEIEKNLPKLYPTIFGYVILGSINSNELSTKPTLLANADAETDLNLNLSRFWELEEPKSTKAVNPEDSYCEDHFVCSHYRLEDGSYGVRLAFKIKPPEFTDTASLALRRFRNQESKLLKNDQIRTQYHEFMREYIDLKHMSVTLEKPAYVVPHHHVSKIDRNIEKLRVVFDASARCVNGSLNDYLLVGPKLQTDIRDILLNFRTHKVALICDIVKMYRNIWIHPDDRKYQTIFWRFDPFEALKTYNLNTVVYGLTSSPFLALRVIKQLIFDEGSQYPKAAEVLKRDIYIDDIVTGCDSLDQAMELQKQLIRLLGKGQFHLSKWASNYSDLLINTKPENASTQSIQPISLISKDDTVLKILGLQWNPETDFFTYNIKIPTLLFTKRAILSNIAKVYDPLGFLTPTIVQMKIFLQELWKFNLDWDTTIPSSLSAEWSTLVSQMAHLSEIEIPRYICVDKPYKYQIVGFADASEKAYSAALYLRIIKDNEILVNLLTAKSKLAPIKTITIPRLELCGCFLLARLFNSINEFTTILEPMNSLPPVFFTDSSIALSWLNMPSYKLKTFVSNRVSEILQLTELSQWRHVSSADNPADCGSRGMLPDALINHSLWWVGPTWLRKPQAEWAKTSINRDKMDPLPDVKGETCLISTCLVPLINTEFIIEFISKFSSYSHLLRTLAWIMRFPKNLKTPKCPHQGPLKVSELKESSLVCVKAVQLKYLFQNDISRNEIDVMKRFAKLNPFFDSAGILRAGGRLYNANVPYNHKHPVILPTECHLSNLIVDYFHKIHLHPGPGLLQALVQSEFWIPSLRRLAQKRTFECNRCYRLKSKNPIPLMGDLPECRVRPVRPFQRVGIDFAGPFQMKTSTRRNAPSCKIYFCLYVCMATKAIHLEPVTSLSADAFMASFERFVSLRGQPSDVYSDRGTNFVSAARHLKEFYQWFAKDQTQDSIVDGLSLRQIHWHFNPAYAPHMGGLWEAGVKSTKSLLYRTVGDTALTYEEFATLLAKIGAVLNSRPLCPMSTDPSECDYLSPGHFIIGDRLIAPPAPDLLEVSLNRLDRWQLLRRMTQFFWEKWRREYLSTLQMRAKWQKRTASLEVGDLVLMKDTNVPVLHWPRARVIDVHPGHDGVVRVATVKTATSTFKRPAVNLIPLFPEPKIARA